jgi:hypothetical protein
VGPRAGLDAVVKIKIPSPCRDSKASATSLSYPTVVISLKLKYVTVISFRTNRMRRLGPDSSGSGEGPLGWEGGLF